MKTIKTLAVSAFLALGSNVFAGGLLTNTNQNIAFNRMFARVGTIGIDGVYSNPAGVAFLSNGLHLSFNFQNVYQTRTIKSGLTVPSLQGTPFYQPFSLFEGDQNGIKEFKGEAAVPILPSFQAAMNYDKWGFQIGFGIMGGGGKATFNDGLASFERTVAMIPALLASQGLTSATPGYSVNSYLSGRQYIYGLQLGSTYKINDKVAVYGGLRFNYISNRYEGSITGITANIDGKNENLYDFFGSKAEALNQLVLLYTTKADNAADDVERGKLLGEAEKYKAMAEGLQTTRQQFADRHLDCTQSGWGITPIIGVDVKLNRLNIGARYEFTTRLNIENKTKHDDTGLFKNGVNTPNDLPGILAVGAQYEVLPQFRVSAAYHYYFDKSARMDKDKQKLLKSNTQEMLLGAEYDITKAVQVSAGVQRTKYGLGNGEFLSDLSFVTSSYSVGFGAGIRLKENMKLNVAYFWTNYETFDKAYDMNVTTPSGSLPVKATDSFTRTNKVLGVGLDIDF